MRMEAGQRQASAGVQAFAVAVRWLQACVATLVDQLRRFGLYYFVSPSLSRGGGCVAMDV